MSDSAPTTVWKLESEGKTIQGASFSPLFPMTEKLIRQRKSFKVTFGLQFDTVVPGMVETPGGSVDWATSGPERTPPP